MSDKRITFPLNDQGFVVNWLVAGPVTKPFSIPNDYINRQNSDEDLRRIAKGDAVAPLEPVKLGRGSGIGAPWKYCTNNRHMYVDYSDFYFTLEKIDILAHTIVVSPEKQRVRARLWSYCAFDLWLNGKHIADMKEPVYWAVNHIDVVLELNEGDNEVYVCMQNIGIRDTRNLFAVQILDHADVLITLACEEEELALFKTIEHWILSVKHDGSKLTADSIPPIKINVDADGKSGVWQDQKVYNTGTANRIVLSVECYGQLFKRQIDVPANNPPKFITGETTEDARKRILAGMARRTGLPHESGYSSIANYMLTGTFTDEDYDRFNLMVDKVNKRIDCADFALTFLLRAYAQLPISNELKERIKDAALNFRYWMDEDGVDAMCFTSENHALLFHSCQMLAGKLWNDGYFTRSGRNGGEQYEVGRRRCSEWLDVIERKGFQEFMADGYMVITLAGLMTLVDFGDEEISERARKIADDIIYINASHSFDGVRFAPQGRVYRTVIYPHSSGVSAMLHYLDPSLAENYNNWLAVIELSKYSFPQDALKRIKEPADLCFRSGNAWITTKKTGGYIMTSVASPSPVDVNKNIGGINEFEPGKYGYQQHMWYAAISRECFTFVNHPGEDKDLGKMRPGYWYGNGVLPAVKQVDNTIYCHYLIPEEHPIHFTHIYWPSWVMEDVRIKNGWMFCKKGNSFMAVWCSSPLIPYDDAIINGEYRAYSSDCVWIVKCSDEEESGSYEEFINECMNSNPDADEIRHSFCK